MCKQVHSDVAMMKIYESVMEERWNKIRNAEVHSIDLFKSNKCGYTLHIVVLRDCGWKKDFFESFVNEGNSIVSVRLRILKRNWKSFLVQLTPHSGCWEILWELLTLCGQSVTPSIYISSEPISLFFYENYLSSGTSRASVKNYPRFGHPLNPQ